MRPREGTFFIDSARTIHEPRQLRDLTPEQLAALAAELREKMIRTVHKTGGHLASSLGAVEITMALHRVMDSPRDRIVWDTGHQAYAHKLLTDRWDRFDTLRTVGGVGGFPRRSESEHDVFDGGHAGTGVSIGVGLAAARDLRKRSDPARQQRIAVCVGDAAIGSGLTMEALNHLGHAKHPLLIVLNDNEMSISPSVGGLSTRLNKMRLSRAYQETKSATARVLPQGPGCRASPPSTPSAGPRRASSARGPRSASSRTWASPTSASSTATTSPSSRRRSRPPSRSRTPVLVHVKTIKGRGYAPAELDSMTFHGASLPPIDLALIDPTEEPLPAESAPKRKPKTYTQTFVEELVRLAETDARITAITAGMPTGTGLQRFCDHFPKRFYDVGIAEQHSVALAAGPGARRACGRWWRCTRPSASAHTTSSSTTSARTTCPCCWRSTDPAWWGRTAPATRACSCSPPCGRCRTWPSGRRRTSRSCATSSSPRSGTTARRRCSIPRDAGEDLADREGSALEIGRGEVLRTGDDVLLVGFGPIVQRLLSVADALDADGVAATVINARWAKPLDEALIAEHAAGKRLVVTAEESAAMGGFGDGVLDALNRAGVRVPAAQGRPGRGLRAPRRR